MAEPVDLNTQIDILDFYKGVQQKRNVTSQYTIDGFRDDIEENITDVSIKKQALEVIALIESQIEENERLEDEEDAEQEVNNDFNPISFLDDDVTETTQFNLTDTEKEAMQQLLSNSENKNLENIESSVISPPHEATLVAKQGLNTAKSFVNSKIQSMDAEKMDEAWQSSFSMLKVAGNIAVKGIVAFYKIPAKRHYKKKLDYTINEINGDNIKSMIEIQKTEMKHRFFVDWLPKLILFLSALLIYNEGWKVGLITLGIGFIYYMITYMTFDYGGSRLLNILAEVMDGQDIRLKDAYYNNILVLYQHLKEFQKAFGVTILENGKVDLYFDTDLGWVLIFYIQEDKNVSFSSITDHRMNFYKILPAIDAYTNTAKLQEGRKVMMLLDQVLLVSIDKAEKLADLLAAKEEFIPCFTELQHIVAARKAEEEARLAKEADDKFYADIAKKKLSERAVNIVKFLRKESDILGMSPHDLNGLGIEGNDDYLKVRMHLNGGLTIEQAQAKLSYVGSRTGIKPKIIEIGTTKSALFLMFYLNIDLKSRVMTMDEIKEEGKKGIFTLGKGYLGDYIVKIPRGDSPFFALIAALARAGKSTVATRLIVNTTHLQDEKGFYDYQDYFIGSVKDEDYIANGFKQSGMFVAGNPVDIYNMLCLIDKIATKRKKIFIDNDSINIKQYNNKFPNAKMGKIMLVMDEYANLLSACGKQKIETETGTLGLRDAIEQKLVKINQEHGSRGVSTIVITQDFTKEAVGAVRNTLDTKILGKAPANVWSTYDNTGQISNLLRSKKSNQGVFLIESDAFQPIDGVEADVVAKFVETKTHFIDTDAIREGFDRTYDTAAKYTDLILNADSKSEEDENPVILSNLNDELVEETTLETNITNDVVDELDEDEVRF